MKRMKKLLTLTLSLFMAFSLCLTISADGNDNDNNVTPTATTYVAKIGEQEYTTLQSAIEVGDGKTIELIASTTEDITIASGKTITLNINEGVTLTNNSNNTITNSGTLTITGSGTIDNVTNQKSDICNNYGATATLKGSVKYTRSQENSSSNTYYYIENYGTMTIKESVTVSSNGNFSSLIRNAKTNPSEYATMTIEAGNFNGGKNTVKNDEFGKLYVKGGNFSNSARATLLNWGEAEISGGTFSPTSSATDAIENSVWIESNYQTKGSVKISSGTFNGSLGFYSNSSYTKGTKYNDGTYIISGGAFSDDVTKYLASDKYNCVKNSEDKYVVVEEGAKVEVKEDVATTPALEEKVYDVVKNATESNPVTDASGNKVTLTDSSEIVLESKEITNTSESASATEPTFTKEQEEKVVKEVSKEISSTVDTSNIELIPLDITLKVVDKTNGQEKSTIASLPTPITVTLYLNNKTLSKLEGKIVKVIRIHKDKEDKETIDVLDATLKNNALSFKTDRFSTYVIASYSVPSSIPTKSYDLKDKNQDGVIDCSEEMNDANWIWSNTKKACVYKVSNTSVK